MKPFCFNWNAFNTWAGIKFVFAIFVLFLLSKWITFPWLAVGLSALLVWLMDILGRAHSRVLLIFIYLVAGTGLTLLSNLLFASYWPWLIFMFSITFLGTLLFRFGMHWFMLGWSLIYWFMLAPLVGEMGSPSELLLSHVLGSGTVLILVIVELAWKQFSKKSTATPQDESLDVNPVSWWMVTSYALIVALVIVTSLILGHRWLSPDPTLIANAAFMIIGFSMINTWKAGLERMLAALLAIVVGFYLGVALQSEVFGMAFALIMSFLVLAFLEVNNGAVVFFFLIIMGYGWGLEDFETGNAIANERIIAEFGGVLLAGAAITVLNLVTRFIESRQ